MPRTDPRMTTCRRVVLLSAALLTACSDGTVAERRTERAGRAGGDIVIGVAWPWTARREMRFGDGVDMAVDEINAAGGVNGRRLRIVRSDDHESADEGRLIAQRFGADPGIVAVIGHLQSYVSVPAAAIYDNDGLVMLAPAATDPALTAQGYRRVFRGTFNDKVSGHQMAEYAARRGYRRIAIQYVRSAYGRALANAFEESASDQNLQIVARQSYGADGVTDETFDAVAAEWSSLGLDAIFLAGEVPSAAYFLRAVRRHGLTTPVLGGDALGSPALLDIAARAADGVVIPSAFHPDEPRADVRHFTAEFRRRYGAVRDAGSALGYGAVRVLAAAMRQAGSTVPDSIGMAMRALRGWRGVTGPFTFDAAGDMVGRRVLKMVVRNNRFEYLPDSVVSSVTLAGSPDRGAP